MIWLVKCGPNPINIGSIFLVAFYLHVQVITLCSPTKLNSQYAHTHTHTHTHARTHTHTHTHACTHTCIRKNTHTHTYKHTDDTYINFMFLDPFLRNHGSVLRHISNVVMFCCDGYLLFYLFAHSLTLFICSSIYYIICLSTLSLCEIICVYVTIVVDETIILYCQHIPLV